MTKRIRVVIADDHTLFRVGLRGILESNAELEVVGEAGTGQEMLALVEQRRPDVVLLDLSMPQMNGFEALRLIPKVKAPRVLVISMHAEKEYVRHAIRAGASGYLLKTSERAELMLAIAAVSRGEVWVSSGVAGALVDDLRAENPERVVLTPRQREVLALIAQGHTTREIAKQFGVSVKTVETHRSQIMERLDIRSVAGLVRYAIAEKLLPPE